MPELRIRNCPQETIDLLRLRAQARGLSAGEYLKRLLDLHSVAADQAHSALLEQSGLPPVSIVV